MTISLEREEAAHPTLTSSYLRAQRRAELMQAAPRSRSDLMIAQSSLFAGGSGRSGLWRCWSKALPDRIWVAPTIQYGDHINDRTCDTIVDREWKTLR